MKNMKLGSIDPFKKKLPGIPKPKYTKPQP
jgi:hypothetical protein